MKAVQDQRNSKLHCNQKKSVTDFRDKDVANVTMWQSPYKNTHIYMDPKLGQ